MRKNVHHKLQAGFIAIILLLSFQWLSAQTGTVKGMAGASNLFDVYPYQQYIDPRNALNTVYSNPVVTSASGTAKAVGGCNASRDATSRGVFLYNGNQFGFNGRYIYAKLRIELGMLKKK